MKKLILGVTGSISSSLANSIVASGDELHLLARAVLKNCNCEEYEELEEIIKKN